MKKVHIYCDGSALGNPGPGGFGTILRFAMPDGEVVEREISEGYINTTNNRMEIMGVIRGLEVLTEPCEVLLISDSKYVLDTISQRWIEGWKAKGWKKADGKKVKNVDLWQKVSSLISKHTINTEWVKGHDGHELNERCDKLAKCAASGSNLLKDEGYVPESAQASLFG